MFACLVIQLTVMEFYILIPWLIPRSKVQFKAGRENGIGLSWWRKCNVFAYQLGAKFGVCKTVWEYSSSDITNNDGYHMDINVLRP